MFIYVITHNDSGKQYVGQTTRSVVERWKEHQTSARNKHGDCIRLENAINKYGLDSFTVTTLAETSSIEELNTLEIFYISELQTLSPKGYNLRTGGENSRHSDETRKRMSDSHKGKVVSEESRRRMSETRKGLAQKGVLGVLKSDEHRKKISESLKGHTVSSATRQKMSTNRSKRKLTKEDVIDILQSLASGQSNREIAREYSVSTSTITDIKVGNSWSWLTGIQRKKPRL